MREPAVPQRPGVHERVVTLRGGMCGKPSFDPGRCHKLHDQIQGPPRKIINLGIIDEQGNDAATKHYTKIVRVPLAGLSCRPATVTLWTPPNQYTRIVIP